MMTMMMMKLAISYCLRSTRLSTVSEIKFMLFYAKNCVTWTELLCIIDPPTYSTGIRLSHESEKKQSQQNKTFVSIQHKKSQLLRYNVSWTCVTLISTK